LLGVVLILGVVISALEIVLVKKKKLQINRKEENIQKRNTEDEEPLKA